MPVNVDLEDKLSASCTASSFHILGEQLKIGLSESEYPDHERSVQADCLSLPPDIGHDTLSLDTFCSSLIPAALTLTYQEYNETVQALYDRSIDSCQ
jgi:hypothetical protein